MLLADYALPTCSVNLSGTLRLRTLLPNTPVGCPPCTIVKFGIWYFFFLNITFNITTPAKRPSLITIIYYKSGSTQNRFTFTA